MIRFSGDILIMVNIEYSGCAEDEWGGREFRHAVADFGQNSALSGVFLSVSADSFQNVSVLLGVRIPARNNVWVFRLHGNRGVPESHRGTEEALGGKCEK